MSQRVRGPAKIRAAITREVWPPFRTAERRPRSEEDPYMIKRLVFLIFFAMVPAFSFASVFGTVRVRVHDPQHRPVQGATVTLKSSASAWSQTLSSNQDGIAEFATVPVGDYQVSVSAQSFAPATVAVAAISGRLQEAHAQLRPATVQQDVTVSAEAAAVNTTSSTPQGTIDRNDIARTPGADRANSLSFITNFVPGAYIV